MLNGLQIGWEMGGPKAHTMNLSLADHKSLETSRGPMLVCDGPTVFGHKMVLTVRGRRFLSMNTLGNSTA